MKHQKIIAQATLPTKTACKILYNRTMDTVEMQVGGTALKFEADSFIMIHEMMRKAAAKIIMQTEVEFSI